ncbi:MAG: hypothetical protein HKM05_05385 [Spirochaetales bacterium]|nr:hypothetical protein [Spirochaetales bacterium]
MNRFLWSLLITFLVLTSAVWSQPSVVPLPRGPLTPLQITTWALTVSGEDPQEIPQSEVVLDTWYRTLEAKLSGLSGAALGDALLKTLHQEFLHRYSTEQTRLDVLLKTGDYNCVSSALVYLILGRRLGLTVEAVEVPSHAFCRVEVGSWVDVETTTAQGWDPGTKKAFHDEFGHVTGYSYVPPGDYTQRRNLDARGLLGLVLQNRCSLLQKQGQFQQAIPLALDRWEFDRSEASRTMLETVYKDAVAVLNNQKNFQQGLVLVKTLFSLTGLTPTVQNLAYALVANQVQLWSAQQEYQTAQQLIQAWAQQKILRQTEASSLLKTLTENELVKVLPQLTPEQAQAKLDQAANQGYVTDNQKNQFLAWIYSSATEKILKEKGYPAGVAYLKQLPPEVQQLPELQELYHQLTQAWAATIHNQFAHLWNAGQHEQAKKVLQEGLNDLPTSQLLQHDQRQLPEE